MGKKKSEEKDVRSRDDARLHRLVSETRAWMKAEGIEEKPLDWEAVAREEQALWWRERLRQALTDLAARSHEFVESIATQIRRLAAAAESQAEAALEVTLDAAQQLGRVLFEPAKACLRPDATLQFSYPQPAMRSRLGLAEGDKESVGLFISSAIPGARVIADVAQRKVTVEFWETLPLPLVVLIPEAPDVTPRVAEVLKTNETIRAIFDNLQPGRYLLSIYIPAEEDKP